MFCWSICKKASACGYRQNIKYFVLHFTLCHVYTIQQLLTAPVTIAQNDCVLNISNSINQMTINLHAKVYLKIIFEADVE